MTITTQHTQECLSNAYVRAVAGRAGVNISKSELDYGVDGTFSLVTVRGNRRYQTGFTIDFQLKCTTGWSHEDGDVVFDLEAKTYNDLVTRDENATPCLLILLCLPDPEHAWLGVTETELILRNCCYWTYLSGDATSNTSTKRIKISRANVLTPDSIISLLATEQKRQKGEVA